MFKRLSELPWSDIEALDRKHLAYVLPIGSTEQHGRHLPVGTDDLILQTSLDAWKSILTCATRSCVFLPCTMATALSIWTLPAP